MMELIKFEQTDISEEAEKQRWPCKYPHFYKNILNPPPPEMKS